MTRRRAPRSRLSLLARGWSVATIATFTGVASHIAAMGHAPGVLLILVCWALSGLLSVLAAGLKGSAVSTAVGVLLTQGVLHTLFAQAGHGVAMQPADGSGSMAMGHAAHMDHGSGTLSATGMSHGAELTPAMIATHVAAAVLTYLAIRRGDEAIAILRRAIRIGMRWLAPMLPRPILLGSSRRALPCSAPLRARVRTFLPGPISPRGPPAFVASV